MRSSERPALLRIGEPATYSAPRRVARGAAGGLRRYRPSAMRSSEPPALLRIGEPATYSAPRRVTRAAAGGCDDEARAGDGAGETARGVARPSAREHRPPP